MPQAPRLHLDHVLIGVRGLEPAASVFADRLGFTLTPEGVHPGRGTHNRLAVFAREYLELIAVRDAAEGVFRPSLNRFLESPEGLYMFALGTDDLDGAVPALRSRGVRVSDPVAGARAGGDGAPGYTWRAAAVDPDATPGSETFLLQHDVAIGDRYAVPANPTAHANGATAVHRLTLAVHDAESAGEAWARVGLEEAGRAANTPIPAFPHRGGRSDDGGVRMAMGGAYLDLASPTGPGPLADFLRDRGEAPYELVLEVADAEATAASLRRRGVAVAGDAGADGAAEFGVDPSDARGVRLAFRQRPSG